MLLYLSWRDGARYACALIAVQRVTKGRRVLSPKAREQAAWWALPRMGLHSGWQSEFVVAFAKGSCARNLTPSTALEPKQSSIRQSY